MYVAMYVGCSCVAIWCYVYGIRYLAMYGHREHRYISMYVFGRGAVRSIGVGYSLSRDVYDGQREYRRNHRIAISRCTFSVEASYDRLV